MRIIDTWDWAKTGLNLAAESGLQTCQKCHLENRTHLSVLTGKGGSNQILAGLLCWTGTGISMAANKIPGVRAALCVDPGTAAGARVWNHANVLALSLRLTSEIVAREILDAWFSAPEEAGDDAACVARVEG